MECSQGNSWDMGYYLLHNLVGWIYSQWRFPEIEIILVQKISRV